jgi:hypothetical protein
VDGQNIQGDKHRLKQMMWMITGSREDADEFVNAVTRLGGVPEVLAGHQRVAIATSDALLHNVPGSIKIADDDLSGPLSDAHP